MRKSLSAFFFSFIAIPFFISFILQLFIAPTAWAEILTQSLVTDGQGILPNSGLVEVIGINTSPTIKVLSYCGGDGYFKPISLTYKNAPEGDIWLIQCIDVETALNGVEGTLRFAIARSRKSDHPGYPVLEPIESPIWQRLPKPECLANPSNPTCDPFYYKDLRVGPNLGASEYYAWDFELPDKTNAGNISLALNMCKRFYIGDYFLIDTDDLYVGFLTSLKFWISSAGDSVVTPDDFAGFHLFRDSGYRVGTFDPGLDAEIESTASVSGTGGAFEVTIDVPMGSASVLGLEENDDYFIVIETSDKIDSGCCTCPDIDPVDKFTATLPARALKFDGDFYGGMDRPPYYAPYSCDDETVTTGQIVCESLVVDLLPIPQQPPYLCSVMNEIHYPGNNEDFPGGKQRYEYFIPQETIRTKYSTEYKLLSGITEDSFDWIFKDPGDPTALFEIPEVTPLERRFAVIGLDVAGGTKSNPEYLDSLTLTLANTFGDVEFDPREHLDNIQLNFPYIYYSGVSIYRDSNDNGIWDEVSIDPITYMPIYNTGDAPLGISSPFFQTPDFSSYNLTFGLANPAPIDLLADRQPDYFIVFRDDSGLSDESPFGRDGKGMNQGANFTTTIDVPFAVTFARAFPELGLRSAAAKPGFSSLSGQDYNIFFENDINFPYLPIQQMIDAKSPPIPILAFNAACSDVPQTGLDDDPIKFQSIKIIFDGAGTGFDPADLDEILIYRDDKSPYFRFPERNVGVFDFINDLANWMPPGASFDAATNPAEESPIPVNPYQITPNLPGNYEVILAPQKGMTFYPRDKIESDASIDIFSDNFRMNEVSLPENTVFPGSDYFVCIKTSDKISYRDIIRPTIPIGGVISSTGPTVLKSEDLIHPEDKNAVVSEIIANVPVILEDLVRTRRGLNPSLGANETDVEVIGINTFTNYPVNGESVYLEQLIIQFIEAASRLSPNFNLGENGDLIHYQDYNGPDTINSGIKVWRVIDGVRYLLKFAETDHNVNTFLDNPSLVASSDAQNQAILMVLNPDDTSTLGAAPYTVQELLQVPETDDGPYAGNDFIITISTSPNFDIRQDNFSVALISWGPDSPNAPKPYQVLNGTMPPEYPPIPPAFSFASSSALLYYQNYPESTRGIGFVDSNGIHSRSFRTINTAAFNASTATRLYAVTNFSATLSDPQVLDRTHQVVLRWTDTNSAGAGRYNESGYWIESDMFGSYQPLPQDPLPPNAQRLFLNGPRFLIGRTVNFRIYAFQEGLNPEAKFPPMNGIGPVAETSVTFDVSVIPIPPTADFAATTLVSGCAPLEVCFIDKSLDDPASWLWDFGDGTTSTEQNPCHMFAEGGDYTVTLTVSNVGGSDTLSKPGYIQANSIPVPAFTADVTTICAGEAIEFTDLSSGNPSERSWDFGDGSTSAEQHPTHVFEMPGTYDVTLSATNACGSDSLTLAAFVTVSEGVVADFISDVTEGSLPLTAHFQNQSLCNPTGCLWDFGDGTTSTEYNPTHLYSAAGTFTVSLTVTKNGDESTGTKTGYITVNAVVSDFAIGTNLGCAPLSVQFTDQSLYNPTGWLWDFGDGTAPSNEQNPTHIYDTPGTFTVSLTASTAYSSDTKVVPAAVTVTKTPVADFSSTLISACPGQMIQFSDESSFEPTSWLWDFGDGAISTEQNPSHAYASVGVFTVSLSAVNACGTNISTKTNYISVDEAPVPAFTVASTEGCAPFTVQFTDQSTKHPTEWTWDFGDGSPMSTEQNPVHVYSSGGIFDVTLTVTNACDSASTTEAGYIVVSEGVTAAFTSDVTEGCPPTTVRFENQSLCSPTSCVWDFGDGATSAEFNPSHVYASAGSYTVSLTVTKGGDSSIETKAGYVTINPLVADFDIAVTAGCAPLTVQFTDHSLCNPASRLWDFGDGTPTSVEQNPIHTYTECGIYTVTLTVSTSTATDTITRAGAVVVSKQPTVDFSADRTDICVGDTISFTDTSSCEPSTWLWNFGDGATSSAASPSHTYDSAGTFTVSLTATNGCGTSMVTKTGLVTVRAACAVDFSASVTAGCVPLTVQFSDLSSNSPTSWSWDFGDGSASTIQNPTHTYLDVGVYTVTLTVRNECGETTETKVEFIIVRAVVEAEFDVGRFTVCTGESVSFFDLSSGDVAAWQWNFGDGSPVSTESNPSHVFQTTGNYAVTLTVSNDCSTSSISHELAVEIFTEPTPGFTFIPRGSCAPLEVCFTNTSTGHYRDQLWEFGDGTSSSDINPPCHIYTEAGTYRITLYIFNPCGVFSRYVDIVVYGEPRADFTADIETGEVPFTVCFTDDSVGGNITSWMWQFGDGGTSSERNPCHTYTRAGKYTVSLTVTSACGTDTFTVTDGIEVYDMIRLLAPANGAYIQEPPMFRWSGSVSNRFRAEYSYDPTFTKIMAATPILTRSSFTVPLPVWEGLPTYKKIFWRVRGANDAVTPLEIHTSEVWTFWKY